jgi:hypothetical protein
MRPSTMRARDDASGRASLEFLVLGVGLMIPVMFVGINLLSLQGASLATQSAATQAAQIFVQQSTVPSGALAAERAVMVALANHGFDSFASLERSCVPSNCLAPGTAVTIQVSVDAPLMSSDLLPGLLGAESVVVSAQATRLVSRYGIPR